jgi:diaminopimelate decarboxylase
VKSCGTLGVLRVLRDCGAGFDVVSGGELHRALAAGGDPKRIAFAGAGKTEQELRAALEAGIFLFNVESEGELARLNDLAGALGRTAPAALRLNPDVDAGTHRKTTTGRLENKFGVDFATAGRILKNPDACPHVVFTGVDLHLGSPINSTEPYRTALEKVAGFVREHRSPSRAPLEWLDVGGGFGLLYRDQSVPTFADFAAAIVPFARVMGCKLVLEPGRSLVGNAGVLLATVQYVKDNGYKLFAIVDAGMNDLVRPAMYDAYHFVWPTRSEMTPPVRLFSQRETGPGREPHATELDMLIYLEQEEMDEQSAPDGAPDHYGRLRMDVVGPICESSDCFAKGRRLPPLARGDRLALFTAGAYGMTMSSNYNARPRPAEALVDGGAARLVRARETYDDLLRGELP